MNITLSAEVITKNTVDTINFSNNDNSTIIAKKKDNFSKKYDSIIKKYAKQYHLDPYLIKCIIKVESNFKPNAISPSGAMGLMQLMPSVYNEMHLDDVLNPEENIAAGIRHFSWLIKKLNNNIPYSLAAYHAGLSRVKRNQGIPPIKSTIAYVNKIMFYYCGQKNFKSQVKSAYKILKKNDTINFKN